MSTPARKSGRQAKPTEKFKEYLYGSDEREVPSKIEPRSSITGHFQVSKEKPSTDATIHSTFKKRGRPRKSILEVDPLKNKTNSPESEDEDKVNYTKGSKTKKDNSPQKKDVTNDLLFKKTSPVSKVELSDHQDRKRGRPRKEATFEPECNNSSTMTDTDSDEEDQSGKNQESGPRRSGRPPKLNKRLLSYLRSDEGPFGENGHHTKKRKENSEILSKKIKKLYYFEELENTREDTSIGNKKALERLKSASLERPINREEGKEEEITDIKKTMINKLEELSRKMLEDDTNHFIKLAEEDSNDLDDPFAALDLENNTEDIDDETSEKVRKWLVEEEIERQRYRRKLLESLKKSHEKSIDTFNQMLKAMETV